jgi:Ca2+-binding EF-hand superfamily protein
MQKIKEADTDQNGNISKAEAEAANLERILEHFDELDADGDGEITRDEMKAARQGKGPRGGKGAPNSEDEE